jgi:hypothetical protein
MIEEFKLRGLKFKVERIEPGNIRETKKRLAYQHAVYIEDRGDDFRYVSLCGSYRLAPKDGYSCYGLARLRTEAVDRGDYTEEELKILYRLLYSMAKRVKIPKFTEILVRGISDVNLTSLFYDKVRSDQFFKYLGDLCNGTREYKRGEIHVETYNRNRYSIYQLIKDLVKDGSSICINPDLIKYTRISLSKRPECTKEKDWAKVVSMQGNKYRANVGILCRAESFYAMCLVKDGAVHTKTLVVKINDSRLRRKLYSAGLVSGSLVFKDELILDLTKIPVISKRLVSNITEQDYLRSCLNLIIQERAYKIALKKSPKEEKPKKERSSDPIKYPEKIISYTADFLDGTTKAGICVIDNIVNSEIDNFDIEVRKAELKKAEDKKRDMTFRYLMSKREMFGYSEDIDEKLYMSMSIKEKTVYAGDR